MVEACSSPAFKINAACARPKPPRKLIASEQELGFTALKEQAPVKAGKGLRDLGSSNDLRHRYPDRQRRLCRHHAVLKNPQAFYRHHSRHSTPQALRNA